MKFTLLYKQLLTLFFLVVIPICILGVVLVNDAKKIGEVAIMHAENLSQSNLKESVSALDELGKKKVKQIATDVAKMLDIYLLSHPDLTVVDLQADPYFTSLAIQPVGETGYTAVHEAEALINRFHKNPTQLNLDLHKLSVDLPEFFSILARTENGKEADGTYEWVEKDGTVNNKYMYVAQTKVKTADNISFSVAATAYLNEFNKPMDEVSIQNEAVLKGITEEIRQYTRGMSIKGLIFLLVTLFVVFVIGSILASHISGPIKQLKNAADSITNGEFNTPLPKVRGNDEISELTISMEMMAAALKTSKAERRQ